MPLQIIIPLLKYSFFSQDVVSVERQNHSERDGETEREISHLQFHSLDTWNGGNWAEAKPRAGASGGCNGAGTCPGASAGSKVELLGLSQHSEEMPASLC